MRSALTAAYAAQPEPAPRLAQAVLARVAQESSVRRRVSTETRSWLDRLDQWFRSLFAPQWVPTVAAIILIAQLGLLLWVTMPAQQEQVMTRSVNSSAAKFNVVFQEQATEGHIRALLAAVHGRIVDGPDSQRMYIIEVTDGDPAVTTKTLEMLRVRTDIVQRAHAIKP